VRITGKNNSRDMFSIQPRKSVNVRISSKTPSKAHEGLRKIAVFSENKRMLILLEGEQLNQYVIPKEGSIDDILEGREPKTIFSFEIKEEYLDFNIDMISSSTNKNEDVNIIDIEEFYTND